MNKIEYTDNDYDEKSVIHEKEDYQHDYDQGNIEILEYILEYCKTIKNKDVSTLALMDFSGFFGYTRIADNKPCYWEAIEYAIKNKADKVIAFLFNHFNNQNVPQPELYKDIVDFCKETNNANLLRYVHLCVKSMLEGKDSSILKNYPSTFE